MPIPVFIAYARVDEAFCKALVKHLGVLEKQGLVRVWYDELIPKGANWEEEIHKHLDEARLVVFLVSADFFDSEYCQEQEMKRALGRHRSGDAQVIPVIVRACGWTRTEIGQIQALPKDAKPVSTWGDKDEAWLSVVDAIEAVALKLREAEQVERKRAATLQHPAARTELKTEPGDFSWKQARWGALVVALGVGGFALVKFGLNLGEGGRPISGAEVKLQVPPASAAASVEPTDGDLEDTRPVKEIALPALDAPEALVGVASMRFKKLSGGTFIMGSSHQEVGRVYDEQQHHADVLAFDIGVYEVTQKQWAAVMNTKPFDCAYGCGDDLPAQNVSWADALHFMNKLTELENKKVPEGGKRAICYQHENGEWTWDRSCTGYRLPTEVEWEYAARAGTTTAYSFGDNAKELCLYGNGGDQAAKTKHPEWDWLTTPTCAIDGYEELAPVGHFKPNPWGLYDMHGNVWEWVWDRYAAYPSSSLVGYASPESKASADEDGRVVRGGSFTLGSGWLRSSRRGRGRPAVWFWYNGFRCARSLLQP